MPFAYLVSPDTASNAVEMSTSSLQFDEQNAPTLPVRVEWLEPNGERQVEVTRLQDVTPRGASLALSQRPEIGQLLHLRLPAPQKKKRTKEQLRHELTALVWALAENPDSSRSKSPDAKQHIASVIFVDDKVPAGSESLHPQDSVYVADEVGSFRLYPREEAPGPAFQVNRRRAPRILMPVEVLVEALDDDGNITASEQTVTENISYTGAAVFTTLDLPAASFVQVTSESYGVTLKAIVCARRVDGSGVARLHLAFTDREWPLEGIG